MLFILSRSDQAPFNIASEEYILSHFEEDVFLLYRNGPSIIVGRNQNTLAEINLPWVREHEIPVVPQADRRRHCLSRHGKPQF